MQLVTVQLFSSILDWRLEYGAYHLNFGRLNSFNNIDPSHGDKDFIHFLFF